MSCRYRDLSNARRKAGQVMRLWSKYFPSSLKTLAIDRPSTQAAITASGRSGAMLSRTIGLCASDTGTEDEVAVEVEVEEEEGEEEAVVVVEVHEFATVEVHGREAST